MAQSPLNIKLELNQQQWKSLKKKLDALKDIDSTAVDDVLKRTAQTTQQEMERYAPFDTGRLKRNIDSNYSQGTDNNLGPSISWESRAIDPDTKKDYAPIQEFGGRHLANTILLPSFKRSTN